MTITYTYDIVQLVCEQKIADKPNAVSGVHITLKGTKNSVTRSSMVYVPILISESSEFINFEELTEAQVRAWIDSQSDLLASYKTTIELLLAETLEPLAVNKEAPWTPSVDAVSISVPLYMRDRAGAYPRLGDQLDMLWHAMDTGVLPKVVDFYDALKAVKDQYPKA